MRALCFERFGGPEVMQYRELPDPALEAGSALVRTRAIGLNFADLYRRRGNYHLRGEPPWIAGYEAAGVIEAVAAEGFALGDRVAFADAAFANAELVAVPAERLIRLPEHIDFATAAGVLLQGLTAQYLARDSHAVREGEAVLVHAAAGGVGLLLVQIARALGARVLAAVSSAEKARAAIQAGATATLRYDEDWVAAAHAFAPGGVDVVYDAVGSTLADSFRATRTGGHVVFYGMAGGDPEPVDPRMLMDTSKSLTGGDLWNVLTSATERQSRADELFEWLRSGAIALRIAARYALADGAQAHAFLESRRRSARSC